MLHMGQHMGELLHCAQQQSCSRPAEGIAAEGSAFTTGASDSHSGLACSTAHREVQAVVPVCLQARLSTASTQAERSPREA